MQTSRQMSGNRIEEGSVTPNPAAASTLSSRRNGDIKEYSFDSGFTAQGNNPKKYTIWLRPDLEQNG